MNRDLHSDIGFTESIRPAVLAASASGSAVDTRGFDSAVMVFTAGAIVASGNMTLTMQESDTTTDGDFANVAAADLNGVTPAVPLTANQFGKLGYRGAKRYLRARAVLNSGTSVALAAGFVLGRSETAPVA
jgi:hypothetical protein